MFIERNIVTSLGIGTRDFDDSDNEKDSEGNYTVWVISKDVNKVKPYTYDEAIALAGHGSYTIGLLAACSLSFLGFVLDMFGFSAIVNSCDLKTGAWQQNVLLSMPFLGAMSSAFLWGYLLDTRGRRFSLVVSMWGAFVASTLSAFSPHWIMLAVLKFISVGFCGCAQSATFMLIGECCTIRVKNTYYCILNSVAHFNIPIYSALSYVILNLSFSWNLGFISFTPWRLLTLCLALPLGISAVCLHFFYESPRFLVNSGQRGLALEYLRKIWRRNKCFGKKYPVEKLVLEEEDNSKVKQLSLLQSMWEQTLPLFRKSLVSRALQLYFLNIILFSTTNSLMVWFPYLVDAFIKSISLENVASGMCKIIENINNTTNIDGLSYAPKLNLTVVWVSIIHGLVLAIINISMPKVCNRKIVVITMMMIMASSAAGCAILDSSAASLFLFFTLFLGTIVNGIIASYFVDLFPTSYRGMAACLSVLISCVSGLVSTNVSRLYIITNCSITFCVMAAIFFCGVIVASFLPSDETPRTKLRVFKKKNSF